MPEQTLAEKHSSLIRGVVARIIGRDNPLYEDAVQESLLMLLGCQGKYIFRSEPQELVYVKRVVRIAARGYVRKDKKQYCVCNSLALEDIDFIDDAQSIDYRDAEHMRNPADTLEIREDIAGNREAVLDAMDKQFKVSRRDAVTTAASLKRYHRAREKRSSDLNNG